MHTWRWAPAAASLVTLTACGEHDGGGGSTAREPASVCTPPGEAPPREEAGQWLDVLVPGAVCADGSPYRIFVKYAERSHDLVVTFEGGGACWDYATCSGHAGMRSAANLDGVEADHMTALPPPLGDDPNARPWSILHPHLGESDPDAPTASAHQVFFPYCTGDVFTGATDVTYVDPETADELTLRHRGHENVELALPWLQAAFPEVGRLLVTGCSAGGVGALVNYSTLRTTLAPRCGFLLDDSGPLLSQTGYAGPMLEHVKTTWELKDLLDDLDSTLDATPGAGTAEDLGQLLPLVARAYPDDRMLLTLFGRDLGFSLFVYQLFYDDPDDSAVYTMWDADVGALRDTVESLPNVGYFMPAFRPDNCVHCLSIVPLDRLAEPAYAAGILQGTADPYLGTEIASEGLRFDDALQTLLSEAPLPELYEIPDATARLDAESSAACR